MAASLFGAAPGAAPALGAAERTIAVVVEFGSGQGLPASFALCVKEPSGATDAQALTDALVSQGLPAPTYSSAGLLCTSAGYPSTGCGARAPGGYSYWAYFHGGSSRWTYATDGPAERRADPAVPEGWRFEPSGHGNPSDAAPDRPSATASICPSTASPANQPASPASTTIPPSTVGLTTTTTTISASTATTTMAPPAATVPVTRVIDRTAERPAAPAAVRPSAGSLTGTMVAVAALGLLITVGVVLTRRRRS